MERAIVRSRVDDSYRVQFSQPRSSRADVSEALTPVALCAWQLKGSTIPTDFRISSSSPSVSRLSEWYIVSIGSANRTRGRAWLEAVQTAGYKVTHEIEIKILLSSNSIHSVT